MRHRPVGRVRVWWWRLRAREACLQAGRHWVVLSTRACLWCGAGSRDLAGRRLRAEDGSAHL